MVIVKASDTVASQSKANLQPARPFDKSSSEVEALNGGIWTKGARDHRLGHPGFDCANSIPSQESLCTQSKWGLAPRTVLVLFACISGRVRYQDVVC